MPTYRKHPAVQARPDGDGAVLLHVDSHQYYELNGSGWMLWQLLDGPTPPEALVEALVARGVAAADARPYVDGWVRELLREGLLRSDEGRRQRWWRRLVGG